LSSTYGQINKINFKKNSSVLNREVKLRNILIINNKVITLKKGGVKQMTYKKPKILAQSTVHMAECRPNSKPSGRPCNPPGPKR
jgi:hypothetical protein